MGKPWAALSGRRWAYSPLAFSSSPEARTHLDGLSANAARSVISWFSVNSLKIDENTFIYLTFTSQDHGSQLRFNTEPLFRTKEYHMKKISKRYLSIAGAMILVGGVAVLSTNSFASGNTAPDPVLTPTINTSIAPTVALGTTDTSTVNSSTDVAEVGDVTDAPSIAGSTDVTQADDNSDVSDVSDAADSPDTTEASDSTAALSVNVGVDIPSVSISTDTSEASDTEDSGN